MWLSVQPKFGRLSTGEKVLGFDGTCHYSSWTVEENTRMSNNASPTDFSDSQFFRSEHKIHKNVDLNKI